MVSRLTASRFAILEMDSPAANAARVYSSALAERARGWPRRLPLTFAASTPACVRPRALRRSPRGYFRKDDGQPNRFVRSCL